MMIRAARLTFAVFSVAVAGCSSAGEPVVPPSPSATATALPTAPASASAVPAVSASADASAPAQEDKVFDLMAGAIDKKVTTAPCDFARAYRGKAGESALSISLVRKGDDLTGALRYDAGSGELELRGNLAGGTLTLTEMLNGKSGGTLVARCDSATGALSGTWTKGATAKPVALKPLPTESTPLAQEIRQIGLGEEARCTFNLAWPAVFGLGDAARTSRINAALKLDLHGVDDAKIERDVRACRKDVGIKALGYYAIAANEKGLLSVSMDGYLDIAPSVHGDSNAAMRSVSIDVPTGKVLSLKDIVKSSRALRPVVTSCMDMTGELIGSGGGWWWEREIQGVPSDKEGNEVAEGAPTFDPGSYREPMILVLADGLAVLIPAQPTVGSYLGGQGPVIRWGALVRAGILNPKSPVSRLWAGVKALAADEPSCVRFYTPAYTDPPSSEP